MNLFEACGLYVCCIFLYVEISFVTEIHGTKVVVVPSKHVAPHRRHRGPVRISDIEDLDEDMSSRKCGSLSTPEVIKVQKALESSSLELQMVVTDPLTEAVQVADTVISDLATKNVIHQRHLGNQSVGEAGAVNNISVEKSTEALRSRDENLGNPSCSHQNNVPRPSLMDRNSTAYTQEVLFFFRLLVSWGPVCYVMNEVAT